MKRVMMLVAMLLLVPMLAVQAEESAKVGDAYALNVRCGRSGRRALSPSGVVGGVCCETIVARRGTCAANLSVTGFLT